MACLRNEGRSRSVRNFGASRRNPVFGRAMEERAGTNRQIASRRDYAIPKTSRR